MNRRGRMVLLLVAAAGWLLVTAAPAVAACHVAGFVEEERFVPETAGSLEVVVELRGRVASCAGTVDVVSVDGAARAGLDYEAVSQTLTFEEGDDRVESVVVTILADDDEGVAENFTLELRNPTGDITGTGDPVTITITADAETPDDAGSDETAEDSDEDGSAEDEGSGGVPGVVLGVVGAVLIGGAALVLLRRRS